MDERERKRLQARHMKRRLITRLIGFISGFALVVGIAGSGVSLYSFFYSRVTINHSSPSHPRDPFSEVFTISNDGGLTIYDVMAACGVSGSQDGEYGAIGAKSPSIGGYTARIEPGDKTSLQCFGRGEHGHLWAIRDIEFDIVVSYRPRFYPWPQLKIVKFSGERTAEGGLQWIQVPIPANER